MTSLSLSLSLCCRDEAALKSFGTCYLLNVRIRACAMVDGLIRNGLSFVKCPLRTRPHVSWKYIHTVRKWLSAPFDLSISPSFQHRVPYFPLEIAIFQIDKSRRLYFFLESLHTHTHTYNFSRLDSRDGTLSMVPRQIKRDLNFHRAANYHRVPINRAFDASQLGIFRLQRATRLWFLRSIDRSSSDTKRKRKREREGEGEC